MQKNIVKLEVHFEGRPYIFLCDNDSPLTHLKEVFFQMQKYVGQIEDQAKQENTNNSPDEVTQLEDTPSEVENVG